MKHYRHIYSVILLAVFSNIQLLTAESFCFRIYLKDKGRSEYRIDNPQQFLSAEAIERRQKSGLKIDESDLPVSDLYLNMFRTYGAGIVTTSKWFSTVVLECDDSLAVENIGKLPMVDSVKWVWKGERYGSFYMPEGGDTLKPDIEPIEKSIYGYAENQIKMLNGIQLHEKGYRGKGVKVAVIDAGFKNANRMTVFDSMNIAGTYNAVSPGESVFLDDEHGVKVLSCLAANMPGVMVGTAPEAAYWLIKSEDSRSEYPVEEDFWVNALEFADSAGVEVVSSSLGYYRFDSEDLNYSLSMLDGETTFISRAAEKAAEKGILLFVSAGNEGNDDWEKITFPSDVKNALTVGAITEDMTRSTFSSLGFTSDNRIKPDVVALGTNCAVANGSGNIAFSSGTSFATPTVAGLGVCLKQALPQLSNTEIIELIRQTSSQFASPDRELGYGIPDFYKALTKHNDGL